MPLARLVLIVAAAVLVAACSSNGASPGGASAPAPSSPATRIEVSLTDTLKIEPTWMTVPAGVPITFVVTNRDAIDHEFYLGDDAAQAEHEREMAEMGGMTHDEPEGIAVKPGASKELTYTFAQAGQSLVGCHIVGHYGAGMKAGITVEE